MSRGTVIELDPKLQSNLLRQEADYFVPADAEIGLLPTMKAGDLCHYTLSAGNTSSPVAPHQDEKIIPVNAWISLTIPLQTASQIHNMGKQWAVFGQSRYLKVWNSQTIKWQERIRI